MKNNNFIDTTPASTSIRQMCKHANTFSMFIKKVSSYNTATIGSSDPTQQTSEESSTLPSAVTVFPSRQEFGYDQKKYETSKNLVNKNISDTEKATSKLTGDDFLSQSKDNKKKFSSLVKQDVKDDVLLHSISPSDGVLIKNITPSSLKSKINLKQFSKIFQRLSIDNNIKS